MSPRLQCSVCTATIYCLRKLHWARQVFAFDQPSGIYVVSSIVSSSDISQGAELSSALLACQTFFAFWGVTLELVLAAVGGVAADHIAA